MAKRRRLLAGGVCAVVLAAVFAVVVPSVAAAADPGECQVVGPDGKCVVVTDPQEPGPGGGPVGGGTWSCLWTGPLDSAVGRAVWPEAPPEASYWLWRDCGTDGGNRQYDRWERVGYLTGPWLGDMQIVASPVAPPSPGEVADDLWSRVEATLPAPVVVVTPPTGRAALLDQPVFVAVSNWTAIDRTACDTVLGIVCVRLQATPRLTFDPGDGADVVRCSGRGTEYDPAGADPSDQAEAPGACVHPYESRTGADGRPAAWSGRVTVTWDVSWSSTAPDASGTFPDFSLSAPLDRPVDEVQGVVVSSGDDSS